MEIHKLVPFYSFYLLLVSNAAKFTDLSKQHYLAMDNIGKVVIKKDMAYFKRKIPKTEYVFDE